MRNNIKIERARNNFTQAELAERVGVSRQTINSIETKKYIPSTILALKIAKEFQLKVDDLFALEEGE